MADTHHKSEIPASTTTRAYTVSYVRDSRTYAQLPAITLRGNWLAEAGFSTGTPLAVKVLPGCLIITVREPAPEAPAEPEIMQTLKQVCKLSARKQQQVKDFVQVISAPQIRAVN